MKTLTNLNYGAKGFSFKSLLSQALPLLISVFKAINTNQLLQGCGFQNVSLDMCYTFFSMLTVMTSSSGTRMNGNVTMDQPSWFWKKDVMHFLIAVNRHLR